MNILMRLQNDRKWKPYNYKSLHRLFTVGNQIIVMLQVDPLELKSPYGNLDDTEDEFRPDNCKLLRLILTRNKVAGRRSKYAVYAYFYDNTRLVVSQHDGIPGYTWLDERFPSLKEYMNKIIDKLVTFTISGDI